MSRKTNKLWYLNYFQQSKWQFSDLRFRNFSLKETELCKWGCDKKSSLQSLRASQLNFNHSCPTLTFYQFLRNSKKKKKKQTERKKEKPRKWEKWWKRWKKADFFLSFLKSFYLIIQIVSGIFVLFYSVPFVISLFLFDCLYYVFSSRREERVYHYVFKL